MPTLLFVHSFEKKPTDKAKFPNPDYAYALNHAIKGTIAVSDDDLRALEAGHPQAWEDLKERMAGKGLHGHYLVQVARGGPGRRGRLESKAEWLLKRESGMPAIGEVDL